MAYRYSRPSHDVPGWHVVEGKSRWEPDRRGMPRWMLVMLAVILLGLGWAIAVGTEPGAPDDSAPLMIENR